MFKMKKRALFLILFVLISSIFLIPEISLSLNQAKILLFQTILGFFALAVALLLMETLFPGKKNLLVAVGLVGGLILMARLLFYYAGGPISWDELYYMYLSMFPKQESSLLNRYFHIYLQRFFFFLTNWDPFSGAKIFWTFCILATAGFTFYNTYLLIPSEKESTRIFGGIFSLLVYFAFPYILDYPGVTYADYTSMMLCSIFIFLYIQVRKNPQIVFFLMGLLFLFSIKTKEIGLCLAVFIFDKKPYANPSNIKSDIKLACFFLLGISIGILFLAINDHFLLNDFLFSLRISNWHTLLSFNLHQRTLYDLIDLFGTLVRSNILYLILFTIYIEGILEKRNKLETPHYFLWAYIITVFAFHLVSTIGGTLITVIRYFVVLAPALGILCAHIVCLIEDAVDKKTVLKLFLYLTACFVINISISFIASTLGWERDLFLNRIFLPMLMLISLFFFFQEKSWTRSIQAGLLGLILFCMLPSKLIALHNRDVENAFERRFQPFAENVDELIDSSKMSLFVSSDVYDSYEILGRDRESNSWMYALLFRQDVNLDQFSYDRFSYENFAEGSFTSAFLSSNDWNSLNMNQKNAIESTYLVRETEKYIFLSVE
ncbi:MAG TPA: hypothetical protein PLL88_08540 [Anaerolineaceae bacterium]|nr:hypothetical protein [Anaerolineaceae bacterium]